MNNSKMENTLEIRSPTILISMFGCSTSEICQTIENKRIFYNTFVVVLAVDTGMSANEATVSVECPELNSRFFLLSRIEAPPDELYASLRWSSRVKWSAWIENNDQMVCRCLASGKNLLRNIVSSMLNLPICEDFTFRWTRTHCTHCSLPQVLHARAKEPEVWIDENYEMFNRGLI